MLLIEDALDHHRWDKTKEPISSNFLLCALVLGHPQQQQQDNKFLSLLESNIKNKKHVKKMISPSLRASHLAQTYIFAHYSYLFQ